MPATRATEHVGKRPVERGKKSQTERRPVGEWKVGKVGTESWPAGTEEGSNTPVGQRPGEFFEKMKNEFGGRFINIGLGNVAVAVARVVE